MIPGRVKGIALAFWMATVMLMAWASGACAVPIKLIVANHFGSEVNLTEVEKDVGSALEDVCEVGSNSVCQSGKESAIAGGYTFPTGAAVESDPASPDRGNIYVADTVNNRIQEITPSGGFVRMFGWGVNQTKAEKGAPQVEQNVCTVESKDVCRTGSPGGQEGQIS